MLSHFLCRYDHLAKSAPTILDDSLSADSYLNVLYMPSTFPRSERSRRLGESASSTSMTDTDFDDEPRSNLDSIRYLECVNYLHEVCQPLIVTLLPQSLKFISIFYIHVLCVQL